MKWHVSLWRMESQSITSPFQKNSCTHFRWTTLEVPYVVFVLERFWSDISCVINVLSAGKIHIVETASQAASAIQNIEPSLERSPVLGFDAG